MSSSSLLDENADPAQDPAVVGGGDPYYFQRQRATEAGGFCIELDHHVLTWLPAGRSHLVITFDNLAAVRESIDREAWGQKFLLPSGFDVLGVQIKRRDWYRDAGLIRALEDLRDAGFFRHYEKISLYGSSMGAFAALAFAPLVPGATIMAFAPQRSLDHALVPFEHRYDRAASNANWALPYGDAADGVKTAARAYIAYDPKLEEDRLHAAMLAGPNVTFLKMPGMGHKLPPALLKMGLLKRLSLAAFAGELELPEFHQMMRARHESMPWKIDLLKRAQARGHGDLALRVLSGLMTQKSHWKLRHLRGELQASLAAEPKA